MADFNRGNKFGGNRDRGDRGGFRGGNSGGFRGRDDREPKQMFPATCDNCHKQCEVPFKPNGSKPVYCKDCFNEMRDETGDRPERSERPARREFSMDSAPKHNNSNEIQELKKEITALNSKVDRILSILNAPVKGKVLDAEMEAPKEVTPVKAAKAPAKSKTVKKKK